MSETTTLLQQLVAIDSVNPDLITGSVGEYEIAHFIANWLEQEGVEAVLDEIAPGRFNVVGVVRGTGGGRSLLLNAHMDTVGVAGMKRPHEPVIEGNRLYGRGAYDMKGGLAAIMSAATRAKRLALRGDVLITAVADEEYASIGTQAIVKKWHADAAIVTEPTELDLCVAHKGFVWLEITTQGIAAHGSLPHVGRDAIVKMGHVLVGLEKLNSVLLEHPTHRLLGSGSLHASLIEGGQELSSYPESCVLQVERRTIPGETVQEVEAQIHAIFEQRNALDRTFVASTRTMLVREAFEIAEDATIVQVLQRQVCEVLHNEPAIVSNAAWMDSALLSAAGIPTVLFGPGGTGAHAITEWSDLWQVERCRDVLVATLQEFCG